MKLNENLKNTFKKIGIQNPDEIISWCLGIHYGLQPTTVHSEDVDLLINEGLIERGPKYMKLKFDLFDTGELAEGIKSYMTMFRDRRLFANEETVKTRIKFIMEKFGYSMAKILELAEYHLEKEKFPRKPHYFLFKGRGREMIFPIKDTEVEMQYSQSEDTGDYL